MQRPKNAFAIMGFFLVLNFFSGCNKAALMAEPPANVVDDFGLAIAQGPTNETSTMISVMVPKDRELNFELVLKESGQKVKARATTQKKVSQNFSPWAAIRILYEGLDKTKTYEFRALDDTGKLIDHREFALLNMASANASFVVAACMDDTYTQQEDMWNTVISLKPDFILMIGDNVYADRKGTVKFDFADPEMLWHRYVQTRHALQIFRAPRLTPIFASWDDHDFGKDDGDTHFKYKKQSREVFEAFFPRDPAAGIFEPGPGIASHLKLFSQDFFLMDDRSFRSKESKETMWGPEQEKWLYSRLENSQNAAWILNGMQFFGAYHPFESFERSHSAGFKSFLKELGKVKKPVVLVSGDRHLTEIMSIDEPEIGFKTYEITTSAIHAITFPGSFAQSPNPRQLVGRDGRLNFAFFKVKQANAQILDFNVKSYTENAEVLYEKDLQVKR